MTNEGGSISEDIIPNNQHSRDLDEFYSLIECLKTQHGGYKYLSNCSGGMDWPDKGVYFFFEPDEMRNGSTTLRVVRVGTHAVSRGSKSTLWGRLRTHKGRVAGGGNHRGSVFRKLVGYALIKRENFAGPAAGTWGEGNSAYRDIRTLEKDLERKVSEHLWTMPFLWIEIDDEAGPDSERAFIERNAIALLSNINGGPDIPSKKWLGSSCSHSDIRESGLWNSNHVREKYSPLFLSRFRECIERKKIGISDNQRGRIIPSNLSDIQKFKNHIDNKRGVELLNRSNESNNPDLRQNWIATVTLETKSGKEPRLNPERTKDLNFIVSKILKEIPGDGVILFPAGFFNKGGDRIDCPFYKEITDSIRSSLSNSSANVVIVAGIDGYQDDKKNDRDQVAFAVDKTNILSIARKHFPTVDDKKFGLIKADFSDNECGKTRFFTLNGVRYYVAVCNDINAGHRRGIKTDQTFDIILNPIHKFEKENSVAEFVRKGMGVESRQWNCPVFGSVKFINGSTISDFWRAGVYWGFGLAINILTRQTKTEKFAIPGKKMPIVDLPGGDRALLEIFIDIPSCCSEMKKNLESFSENSEVTKKLNTQKSFENHPKWREVFKNTVVAFHRENRGANIRSSFRRESQCRFSIDEWPKIGGHPTQSICYEFDDWKERKIRGKTLPPGISVEIQFWVKDFSEIGKKIEKNKKIIAEKMAGNPHVCWDKEIDPRWYRLQFFYVDPADPEIIARSMLILIQETQGVVNDWMTTEGYSHY